MNSLTNMRMKTTASQQAQKRRAIFKQKCNQLHNYIDLDIAKLDSLLKIVNGKGNKDNLNCIIESNNQEINNESGMTTQSASDWFKSSQIRERFKYSISREYDFIEEVWRKEDEELKDQEENLLLDQNDQDEPKTMNGGWIIKKQIEKIIIETRYRWIEKYLQKSLSDTIVKGKDKEGNQIQIIKYDQMNNVFEVKFMERQSNSNVLSDSTNFQKLMKKSGYGWKEEGRFKLGYSQFLGLNRDLQVMFPKHAHSIALLQPNDEKKQVVRLKISQNVHKMRLLIKSTNFNENKMQRIMIFKEIPETQQMSQTNLQVSSGNNVKEKYKIIWTRYEKQSFTEDILLDGGCNYLITNLCSSPCSQVQLIFIQSDLQKIHIQKAEYDPWRSYNLLCSSFEQCSKVFMSENIFDNSKPLQFYRANFLDFGIILEIYQNIYGQRISFLQKQNDQKIQDKELLFPELYSKLHNYNAYLPEELVIKFYEVTEKPARLYFPQKHVLVGERIAQHTTIYSTFK